MTQTVPATAVLGPGKTGLTVGLRVLNLDGTEYAAFSTTGVAETSVAGTYRKAGGVVVPDAGGYIVWGVSGTDYAEATVESAAVLHPTQGAVTFGQVKIAANVSGEGALDLRNSNANGLGMYTQGGNYGQKNYGSNGGLRNEGVYYGQSNHGATGLINTGATAPVEGVDAAGIRTALGMAAADLDTQLDAILAANPAGSGAISFPVTINDEDSNPIDGVEVWISTDSAGTSVVAGTLSTSALGVATFMLDAGTYYLWRQKSGYNFTNPVTIVVS